MSNTPSPYMSTTSRPSAWLGQGNGVLRIPFVRPDDGGPPMIPIGPRHYGHTTRLFAHLPSVQDAARMPRPPHTDPNTVHFRATHIVAHPPWPAGARISVYHVSTADSNGRVAHEKILQKWEQDIEIAMDPVVHIILPTQRPGAWVCIEVLSKWGIGTGILPMPKPQHTQKVLTAFSLRVEAKYLSLNGKPIWHISPTDPFQAMPSRNNAPQTPTRPNTPAVNTPSSDPASVPVPVSLPDDPTEGWELPKPTQARTSPDSDR